MITDVFGRKELEKIYTIKTLNNINIVVRVARAIARNNALLTERLLSEIKAAPVEDIERAIAWFMWPDSTDSIRIRDTLADDTSQNYLDTMNLEVDSTTAHGRICELFNIENTAEYMAFLHSRRFAFTRFFLVPEHEVLTKDITFETILPPSSTKEVYDKNLNIRYAVSKFESKYTVQYIEQAIQQIILARIKDLDIRIAQFNSHLSQINRNWFKKILKAKKDEHPVKVCITGYWHSMPLSSTYSSVMSFISERVLTGEMETEIFYSLANRVVDMSYPAVSHKQWFIYPAYLQAWNKRYNSIVMSGLDPEKDIILNEVYNIVGRALRATRDVKKRNIDMAKRWAECVNSFVSSDKKKVKYANMLVEFLTNIGAMHKAALLRAAVYNAMYPRVKVDTKAKKQILSQLVGTVGEDMLNIEQPMMYDLKRILDA